MRVESGGDFTPNTILNPRMRASRGLGEYQIRTPGRITGSDIPVGFVSHVWTKRISGDIQHAVDGISKQFPGAGWKYLPQELVDEILGYLLDDLGALRACSLTCRYLFGAARPYIHQRLVCVYLRPEPKWWLFGRCKGTSGAFGRLIDADRLGVLRYTRHLSFKVEACYPDPGYNLKDLEEYLPHLRSITKLDSLALDTLHVPPFTPIFNEHFGMFTNTIRHLDIRRAEGAEWDLSYLICRFPLLEDLTIVSPAGGLVVHPGRPVPTITQSPPLRGKLALVQARSRELSDGLVSFPGGLNFRSLELSQCKHPEAILAACGHTATSISYLWRLGDNESELNSSIQVRIVMYPLGTIVNLLDLGRNVALERFELSVMLTDISLVHGWVHRTLQTITSPVFNKFVVWVLGAKSPWSRMDHDGWKAIDALLDGLAKRNPDFRVVFITVGLGDWRSMPSYLPLVWSKRLVKFSSPRVENRFRKLGVL